MEQVLIDTDVILDFFFNRQPFSGFAAKLLTLCELKEIRGFVSPVLCSNVYYLLRKTAKHEIVVDKLRQLLTIIDVVTIDKEIVLNSLNSKFNDFEDALQNFAAAQNGTINVILTRNIKDYKNSELEVLTPENYLETRSAKR